jgi:hypothetical protein
VSDPAQTQQRIGRAEPARGRLVEQKL